MADTKKHRCGGELLERNVRIDSLRKGIAIVYTMPGWVCSICQQELIDRKALFMLEGVRPTSKTDP